MFELIFHLGGKKSSSDSSSSTSQRKSEEENEQKFSVQIKEEMFLTPPKEIQANKKCLKQNSENGQLLGKRTFRCELERELELFMPSKFFVVTNDFYKRKLLVKNTVN